MEVTSLSFIPESTISWLLASQTPSLRYLTLTQLLQQPPSNPDVTATRKLIASTKPVASIFSKQAPEGFWSSQKHYYSPKYRSSHWTMFLLTELAVPPDYPAMQLGGEFMQKRMEAEVPYYHQEDATGFCCFWGNWLRYELYCGNINQPKVQQVIDFVCRDIYRSGKCRYNNDLPCAWAIVRSLFGLALIPEDERSAEVEKAIERGIAFMVEENDLLTSDYPYVGKVHELWHRLSFPLFYHTDILFGLRTLRELDALDHPGAQPALQWLKDKQTKKGIWHGGSPLRSRTRPFLQEPDTVSHWITMHAASVIQSTKL
jgi:hypothetical protein